MQFTTCTTRKPLFHDPYGSYVSYESYHLQYTLSATNDMEFTTCTTRKLLFHDPYGSYDSYESTDAIYDSYQVVYIGQPSFWCERSVKFNLCFILSAAVIGLPLNSMNMSRIRHLITKCKIGSLFFKIRFP